jgi:putative membrane-bound dehydrogenase-like protein
MLADMKPRVSLVFCLVLLAIGNLNAANVKVPVCADSRLELTLVAAEPDIVTPIGTAIDKRGRVFVVESHTHFPKSDYAGPKYDRVKLWMDTNHDGKADKFSIFAEGFHHAMNLAFAPDGALYLVYRNGVIRLEDKDGDGVSESRMDVLKMETAGDYPHNGLGGITFSPDGWLYVGQGENLGEGYTLKGTDGSSHSGKGEGGNIFRCRPDGRQLQLVATGFWNPFGLAFYGKQFLLAVDNDPDSRPPNRLLDVVMHGDYGFKFRLGRNGLHPFQSWNGELPGTLPMVSGTGEAACSILSCDRTVFPPEYRDAILITAAWDHQIEVHHPKLFGASLRADREILVHGDESFRPVALAAAPDGSVYFSDWVDESYNVHGKGRLWRLAARTKTKPGNALTIPANPSRRKMERLANANTVETLPELTLSLASNDPFVRGAAIAGLSRPVFRDAAGKELTNKSAALRLGALLALRRAAITNAADVVGKMLADPDEQVRRMALVWAGEQELVSLTNRLSVALKSGPVSPTLLSTHAAAARILARGTKIERATGGTSGQITFFDPTERVAPQPFIEVLKASGANTPFQVRIDAVRQLAQSTNGTAIALLKRIAADRKENEELRCEALGALAGGSLESNFLIALLGDAPGELRVETVRALRGRASELPVREALRRVLDSDAGGGAAAKEQARFVLAGAADQVALARPPERPGSDEEWRKALAGKGDTASGRRIFFNASMGCARCHRIEDYGGQIGPDLSTIARGSDREKLMQSILHPSRDIAPQFVTHTIETKDGQEFSGLLIGQSVNEGATLFMADGRAVLVPPSQIVSQTQSKVSLMPEGLVEALTVQDFRDLLAFLVSRK